MSLKSVSAEMPGLDRSRKVPENPAKNLAVEDKKA
jgi:hypothetical protein